MIMPQQAALWDHQKLLQSCHEKRLIHRREEILLLGGKTREMLDTGWGWVVKVFADAGD
jgi:hypothetical protein